MKPKYSSSILFVFVLAAQLLTMEADSKDECDVRVKVPRNTRYNTFLWEDLRINCTVTFCKDPPPEVSWYKLEQDEVPVNFSRGSRFRGEWKRLEHLKGVSFLIIQKTVTNDSGVYRCQSGPSIGYNINVSVSERVLTTTDTWTTSAAPETAHTDDSFLPSVYRIVGIMVFVIIVTAVYISVESKSRGVSDAGPSRDAPDPDEEHSYHALPMDQIYENTQ
ncbi:B- and T-lymphocyte attenuator-like [Notolabrus celidotus]|uniref:B- and T-lymphocyte attenuator-like n=1 Tax=Notolabrus celidotus TaxID=1203425 RepID=UPI00148F9696|nr:B- and T-lymphocyte attenuator-like [Notolabrus celidotus]